MLVTSKILFSRFILLFYHDVEKSSIKSGMHARAENMLCFFCMNEIISGQVIKGRGLAMKMGFPTINLPYDGESRGVFCAKVFLGDESLKAVMHLGERPTVDDDVPVCEIFILDWRGNIKVGDEIKVERLKKIRDIKKFKSLEALKEQIASDVEFAKMIV